MLKPATVRVFGMQGNTAPLEVYFLSYGQTSQTTLTSSIHRMGESVGKYLESP